jgi:hypothetical protein
MSSRGRDRNGRIGRSFAGGFVRIPRRRRGKRSRMLTVTIMILIALVFVGTIIRRSRVSPRYLGGHSHEYGYRQVAPDENLAPGDDRRLDQIIRDRSQRQE